MSNVEQRSIATQEVENQLSSQEISTPATNHSPLDLENGPREHSEIDRVINEERLKLVKKKDAKEDLELEKPQEHKPLPRQIVIERIIESAPQKKNEPSPPVIIAEPVIERIKEPVETRREEPFVERSREPEIDVDEPIQLKPEEPKPVIIKNPEATIEVRPQEPTRVPEENPLENKRETAPEQPVAEEPEEELEEYVPPRYTPQQPDPNMNIPAPDEGADDTYQQKVSDSLLEKIERARAELNIPVQIYAEPETKPEVEIKTQPIDIQREQTPKAIVEVEERIEPRTTTAIQQPLEVEEESELQMEQRPEQTLTLEQALKFDFSQAQIRAGGKGPSLSFRGHGIGTGTPLDRLITAIADFIKKLEIRLLSFLLRRRYDRKNKTVKVVSTEDPEGLEYQSFSRSLAKERKRRKRLFSRFSK